MVNYGFGLSRQQWFFIGAFEVFRYAAGDNPAERRNCRENAA
jgi:hypothetical protein